MSQQVDAGAQIESQVERECLIRFSLGDPEIKSSLYFTPTRNWALRATAGRAPRLEGKERHEAASNVHHQFKSLYLQFVTGAHASHV